MSPFALYGLALALGLGIAFAAWLWHLKLRNAGVIDIVWGLNLAGMAFLYALLASGAPWRRALLASMIALSGGRLSLYIARRTLGQPEEGRYRSLREAWGQNLEGKFLVFFLAQAFLASCLSLPFLFSCINPMPEASLWEEAALAIFGLAWVGEALADSQLRRFKADPSKHGQTCEEGLWYYSRHPNYFFEWLLWLSYFVFACGSPWGWTSFFAPLLMLHFLLNVTGVKATEAQCLKSRGESYARYQKSTSAFIPWFKRA